MRVDQVGTAIKATSTTSQRSTSSRSTEAPVIVHKTKEVKRESSYKKQEMQTVEVSDATTNISSDQDHEVIQAIEKANKHIRSYDRKLEFSIHEATKKIMVKVINTEDDSIIREIPSEKVLDMVAHLWEVAGLLVDEHR